MVQSTLAQSRLKFNQVSAAAAAAAAVALVSVFLAVADRM
jgi:hypothetical protein